MKKPSPFARPLEARPIATVPDSDDLVVERHLDGTGTMPLVIEPAIPDLDYPVWLTENRDRLEEKLQRHGAILFRGFPIETPADFEKLASCLTTGLYGNYGDLPPSDTDRVYGVTPYPPEGTILFHNESSHMHQWPMRQFFFCDVPAREGGETPIVDCRQILRDLEPELVALLAQKKLRYVRNFLEGVDVSWQDFFKTDNRAEVAAHCAHNGIEYAWKGETDLMTYQIAPAVARHPTTGESVFFNQIQLHHVSCLDPELRAAMARMISTENMPRNVFLGDGGVLEDDIVARITACYWKHAVSFSWQHGDVLMVDNMLVAHARNPYVGPRRMYVAMGDIIHADTLLSSTPG